MDNKYKSELTNGLTPEQAEAVTYTPEGKLRIAAGAGSGKTEVLTRRISGILASGILPEEMVAITYTQKAAAEMKARLIEKRKLHPSILRKMEVSTFHAFLSKFLRQDPFGAGIDRSDTILTENGRQLILAELKEKFAEIHGNDIIAGKEPLGATLAAKLISDFPSALSNIRRFLLSPHEFFQKTSQFLKDKTGEDAELAKNCLSWLFRFFHLYLQELQKRHLLDFDEILIKGKELIHSMREGETLPERRIFLIDEFQDNNSEQLGIVEQFTSDRDSHITVVGDEKQSIYRFQGAEVQNFREFPSDQDIFLKDNFRSYEEIIKLADSFLEIGGEAGKMFIPQHARMGKSPRENPVVCFLHETKDKAEICNQLTEMIHYIVKSGLKLNKTGKPANYGDIAIIVSSIRSLPSELEDALAAKQIPYIMSGGLGFYARSEINEILAFLKLLAHPQDDHALVKILTGPLYGLSDSELALLATSERHENTALLPHILALPKDQLPLKAKQFRELYIAMKQRSPKLGILDLCHNILEQAGFYEYAASQRSELKRRRMENNLNKFLNIVRNFEQNGIFTTIRDFLKYVEKVLNSGIEEDEAGLGLEEGDALKILTIHKSKGLEFPIVICPFLQKRTYKRKGIIHFTKDAGLLINKPRTKPIEGSPLYDYFQADKQASESEDRRKLYVAFTRAEEMLIIAGDKKASLPPEKEPKEPTSPEPLLDIRKINEQAPDLVNLKELENWQDTIDNWLSFGQTEPVSPPEEKEVEIDIENLTSELEAITAFVSSPTESLITAEETSETYSLADISMFQSCPRKFFFTSQHIKSFTEKETSFSATVGTMVHESIRLFHTNNGHLLDEGQKTDLIKENLERIKGLFPDGEEAALRASKLLEVYIGSELAQSEPFLMEAEVNIKFNAPTGPFFLRGFVDRVNNINGEIQIVDFKTRSYSPEAHKKYSDQLALYLIAAQKGVIGKIGALNFPSAHIAYLTQEKLELKKIAPDLIKFENETIKCVEEIRIEKSWQPKENAPCSKCGFMVLCNGMKPKAQI
jgi:DNA helicase-2/ATP-dependent DNA helicase PcrA